MATANSLFCSACGHRMGAVSPPSMFSSSISATAPAAAADQALPVYTQRRRGGGTAVAAVVVLAGAIVGGTAFAVWNVQSSVQDVFDSTQERYADTGALGEELTGPGDLRATVSAYDPAVQVPPSGQIVGINAPRPGYSFITATAYVCVGATGFIGPTDFAVRMEDGTDEPALITQRAVPGGLGSVTQSQCRRGSLVFEIPAAGRPRAIALNGRDNAGFANPLAPVRLEWALPD